MEDPLRAGGVDDGEAGTLAGVPLLVGATRDEVRLFQLLAGDAYRPADEEALYADMRRIGTADPAELLDTYRARTALTDLTDLADLRTAFLSDAIYRVPATRPAGAQSAAGGRAYHYLLCEADAHDEHTAATPGLHPGSQRRRVYSVA